VIHLAANISATIEVFFCNVESPCKIHVIHTESQKLDRSLYTQNAVEVTAPLHTVSGIHIKVFCTCML